MSCVLLAYFKPWRDAKASQIDSIILIAEAQGANKTISSVYAKAPANNDPH